MARKSEEIRQFIVENVGNHPQNIAQMVAEQFGVSRAAITRHINVLIKDGVLTAIGKTKAREYKLRLFVDEGFDVKNVPELQEHIVWREKIAPHLQDVPKNVFEICEHGFTEIFNNAMEHSGTENIKVLFLRDAVTISFYIGDEGVGIFNKIKEYFPYISDTRHAAFELSKGRLTSDRESHAGWGIFFASRMFDSFFIASEDFAMVRPKGQDTWILEQEREPAKGTRVSMHIQPNASQTKEETFSKYGSKHNELGFIKTHVPLALLKYEGEELVSRSQAKRLLSRINNFEEAILDFSGVNTIGHSFADEIFRVYKSQHPEVAIIALNITREIKQMIEGVVSTKTEDDENRQ